MKNILLINLYDFTIKDVKCTTIGLLSLKAVMANNSKYNVDICDFNKIYSKNQLEINDNLDSNILIMSNYIRNYNPDLISIYTMCNNYHLAILLEKKLKEICPDIVTMLAGPHATMTATETLKAFKFVDYVAMGEGESTLESILDGIFLNDLKNVKGLAYRDNDEIIINYNFDYLCDLDSLPYLEFDGTIKLDSIDIEVGRGCPFNCTFCSTNKFWGRKFRLKSIPRLIDEILYYQNKYNVNHFNFHHDLFTFRKDYILKFCSEVISRKIKITWFCSARIDTLDEEMIKIMNRAGCNSIFIGIETGAPTMQASIRKNLKLDRIYNVVDLLLKYNLEPTFSFIYGFPKETDEELNSTLNLIHTLRNKFYKENKKVTLSLWPLNYLPGTDIIDENYDTLKFDRNDIDEGFSFSLLLKENDILSLIESHKDIFINYYSSEDTKKFIYLKAFITNTLNENYRYINLTLDTILKLYQFNYIKLYNDMFKFGVKELEHLSKLHHVRYKNLRMEDINSLFNLFELLISNNKYLKENILLNNVLKFEKEFFNFLILNQNTKKVIKLNYNVYEMKKNKTINDTFGEYSIEFEKNSSNLYIRKLDNII